MKILLIGNFAPPYEEENLYNHSLLTRLRGEGHDCSVLNISENPSSENGIHDINNYFDFILKLVRLARKREVIHFLTRGYTRLGLLKLALAVFFGRLFRVKTVISFHSELLSMIGLTRSPFGGQQTVRYAFSRAHKIIFEDRDTYNAASIYKRKDNFAFIPSFISIPENIKDSDSLRLTKLKDKKRIIVFSNVAYPSFLFEILNSMLAQPPDSDIGIAVSLSEKPTAKLQHALEETGKPWKDSLIFLDAYDIQVHLAAYTSADLIVRPLSCDGSIFFRNIAVSLKRPVYTENCLYFPNSLILLKEGDIADLCAFIMNSITKEKTETTVEVPPKDFYLQIKELYGG
jgi:hypothetical protein